MAESSRASERRPAASRPILSGKLLERRRRRRRPAISILLARASLGPPLISATSSWLGPRKHTERREAGRSQPRAARVKLQAHYKTHTHTHTAHQPATFTPIVGRRREPLQPWQLIGGGGSGNSNNNSNGRLSLADSGRGGGQIDAKPSKELTSASMRVDDDDDDRSRARLAGHSRLNNLGPESWLTTFLPLSLSRQPGEFSPAIELGQQLHIDLRDNEASEQKRREKRRGKEEEKEKEIKSAFQRCVCGPENIRVAIKIFMPATWGRLPVSRLRAVGRWAGNCSKRKVL